MLDLLYLTLAGQDQTESTAFLGALWAFSAQSALRKAVDLGFYSLECYEQLHSNVKKNIKLEEN